ncbi:zinc finger protein 613-like [Sitodiplosis mosellana]|uniref:zinc finger protein 613-like n=1 Tax=Sitodiplosis mosellana TaxID=263140 RepID=UPI002444466A|nr:zinc finger protein 613-like [Sitodiplosis mosellana]
MSANQNQTQSADSIEIKQEGEIKQEPVSVDEVVEVSESTYHNLRCVPGFNDRDVEYDFDHLNEVDAKVKVKKECEDNKEEDSKMNDDSKEEATGSQQNQRQPLPHGEGGFIAPESDASGRDTQKRGDNAYVNQTKKHKCYICIYSTRWNGDLNKHMLKHTGEKPHGCDFVEEFLFHCPGCLQGFGGKNEEEAHEVKCKTRRYECHLCKDSFGSMKGNMMKHMRVHSGDKPFQCNECFKRFVQKSHLKEHMKFQSDTL